MALVLHRAYYIQVPASEEGTVEEQAAGGPGQIASLLALPEAVRLFPRSIPQASLHY